MNESFLQRAKVFFGYAEGDGEPERNLGFAIAAAAIAQAEAAERQAVAMERIDRQLARIATVLNELTSPKLEAPDWDEDGDE